MPGTHQGVGHLEGKEPENLFSKGGEKVCVCVCVCVCARAPVCVCVCARTPVCRLTQKCTTFP